MQSDDGVRPKWYNPATWTMFRPKGVEEFKGEGLRGGIQSVSIEKRKEENGNETEQSYTP